MAKVRQGKTCPELLLYYSWAWNNPDARSPCDVMIFTHSERKTFSEDCCSVEDMDIVLQYLR